MGERIVENGIQAGEPAGSHSAGCPSERVVLADSTSEQRGMFEVLVWSQLELGDAYQRELETIRQLAV